ncbi:bola protein [Achaetomium macrosporum]|uniref:Bola protein n=1 Tax=Achaetomium macrosporum TaxID=79813 RepID=A0AAN7CB11_9PEZI|nr:bola protein [Achaetomium macrosporum]
MICRACLRARAAFTANARRTEQSLLRAAQRRPLSTTGQGQLQSRVKAAPSRSQLSQCLRQTSGNRLFSTSGASSSASAQPQDAASTSSGALQKPNFLSEGESQVWDRLAAEFAPTQLVVQDISGGCGSMYGIEISSEKFRGLTMLKQQRLVNAALGDLMKDWHGVQLKTRVP